MLRFTLRRSSFASLASFASFVLVACAAPHEEDAIVGPPPAEPLVFAASEETTSSLGIARWGVDVGSGKTSTFRGYGRNNEVLVEVVQRDELRTESATFTMSMTGPLATAAQKIELYTVPGPSAGAKTTMIRVPENTFGSEASKRVLERFTVDAKAADTSAGAGATLLSGRSRPLSQTLVTYCNPAANPCSEALIVAHIALAGAAEGCGFGGLVGEAAISCGVGLIFGGIVGCGAGAAGSLVWDAISCVSGRGDAKEKKDAYTDCEAEKCGGVPRPECEPDANGYSCSPDPVTMRDRVCCNGQCVSWVGSACDR